MKFRDNTKSVSAVKKAAGKIYFTGGCHARDDDAVTLALNIVLEETGYVIEDILIGKKIRRLKSMNEYDPKYWKHGVNVTAGQFCDYVKKNVPSDAVLYICGDNNVNLHYSSESNMFSADYDELSDLPEYEGCKAGEFVNEVSS